MQQVQLIPFASTTIFSIIAVCDRNGAVEMHKRHMMLISTTDRNHVKKNHFSHQLTFQIDGRAISFSVSLAFA